MMNLDFLHIADYEIFNTTFNGIFERTAYDVWYNWYVYHNFEAINKVTIWCIVFSISVTLLLKLISGIAAVRSAYRFNPKAFIFYGIGYLRTGVLLPFIYCFMWVVGITGYTIYYMMGYTI